MQPYFLKQVTKALLAAVVLCAAPAAWGQRARIVPMPAVGPSPAKPTGVTKAPSSLHIPTGNRVNFNHEMTDGDSYRWDLQYYGTVGQGTNYAYSGGLYLQMNGNNFQSNGQGWSNKDGDEIELGPWNYQNLTVHRRVKVYKDQGLARWLDIFENKTGQEIRTQIAIYSNSNWMIARQLTSSGGAQFGEKDWAFATEMQNTGNNTPATLHMVCGPKSKLRPQVQVQHNQIYVRYNLVVPANGVAVLCYFEKQHQSMDELAKTMKTFKASKALKDLSSEVRKLIVNFPAAGGGDVDLEREESIDLVMLTSGDPMKGSVANESFELDTLFGKLVLPAKDVIGMAALEGQGEVMRAQLKDGQVVSGRLGPQKLKLNLPSGGELEIPFDRVQKWAYRISKDRPEEIVFKDPMAMLRTGDCLTFDPAAIQFRLRTVHGTLDLNGKDLLEIAMDNPEHGVHQVTFVNGSSLAGLLEPETFALPLRLGKPLEISRNMVGRLRFALEERPDPALTQIALLNGDNLLGTLTDESFSLTTEFGTVNVIPQNIRVIEFNPALPGMGTLSLWDGTVLRGRLATAELSCRLLPGPDLKVRTTQLARVERSSALPPEHVGKRVDQLIAQLGAESYKDRESATADLIKMGEPIAPLLRKNLDNKDPEVRQRLEDILEKIGGKAATPDGGPEMNIMVDG